MLPDKIDERAAANTGEGLDGDGVKDERLRLIFKEAERRFLDRRLAELQD